MKRCVKYDMKVQCGAKRKKLLFCLGVLLMILLLIYLGMAVYFRMHFLVNTTVNGIDVSGKSAAYLEKQVSKQLKEYQLSVISREGKTESIKDLKLSLDGGQDKEIEKELKKQNTFLWPYYLFQNQKIEMEFSVKFDQEELSAKVRNLSFLTQEQTEPVSAIPVFDGEKYMIQDEIPGNQVNVEQTIQKAAEYVKELKEELNLETEQCYVTPRFTKDSEEVVKACEELNGYCTAKITYQMSPEPVIVDKTLIATWLDIGEDMRVSFSEERLNQWVTTFCDQYSTVGKVRSFVTPAGRNVEVSSGTYGWKINAEAERQELLKNIQERQVIEREPIYEEGYTAASHGSVDWGTTYAEVDLTNQHMWYIKDSKVVFECDIVSGKPVPDKETPSGVYKILEKKKGKTLVGAIVPETGEPEYRTYVDYWMRVTWSGIGFHDANWQPKFGGDWYVTHGSHGCLNMRPSDAASLYDMIEVNTPVIIHY